MSVEEAPVKGVTGLKFGVEDLILVYFPAPSSALVI